MLLGHLSCAAGFEARSGSLPSTLLARARGCPPWTPEQRGAEEAPRAQLARASHPSQSQGQNPAGPAARAALSWGTMTGPSSYPGRRRWVRKCW